MSQIYYNPTDIDIENEDEDEDEDEDYIDMEVSSFTHFLPEKISFPSPQHAREFEFHMSFANVDKDSTPSPADELFYKGKLLPLHLPPRLQMVEKLLKDSPSSSHFNKFSEVYATPLGTNTVTTPATTTPFESCNVSPVQSCQVSRELKPEEYFGEQKGFILLGNNYQKMSWSKKLKIKITKIKALFGKSASSEESTHVSATNIQGGYLSKVTKKNPFGLIPSVVTNEIFGKENQVREENVCHRRSFSGAFKRRSLKTKASSSSSSASSSSSSSSSSSLSVASSNSSSLNELLLKRSSSANSEIETSLILGAIAHCKQSQRTIRSRKTLSEVGCHSFPSRLVAFDDEASEIGVCRG